MNCVSLLCGCVFCYKEIRRCTRTGIQSISPSPTVTSAGLNPLDGMMSLAQIWPISKTHQARQNGSEVQRSHRAGPRRQRGDWLRGSTRLCAGFTSDTTIYHTNMLVKSKPSFLWFYFSKKKKICKRSIVYRGSWCSGQWGTAALCVCSICNGPGQQGPLTGQKC